MNALRCLEPLLYEESYQTARLVARARSGNREAFDQLMAVYRPPLRAFVQLRVGREAVEDVVQETCIAAYTTLPKFNGKSRFKAWLFGIAHHKSADYFRAHNTVPKSFSFDDSAVDRPAPGDHYAHIDLKLMVAELLKALPAVQREVLELYYFGDLTLAEVASVLGRSSNTVKAQFYRGHAAAARVLPADATALSEGQRKSPALEGVNLG